MIVTQSSFAGGLDQVSSDTNIAEDSYSLLINARNRFHENVPIKKHVEITNKPTGHLNGGYGIGNTLLLFVDGKAYYQIYGKDNWNPVPGFLMSTTADYYFEVVPASSFNFERKLTGDVHSPMYLNTNFRINGTPQGLIVQDGSSQPWIIQFDEVNQQFTSRELKKYADWKNSDESIAEREYVPIGRMMMYKAGKLYIVAPDYKSVYQSVTGRPLDFVINVDTNGNKLASEKQGGAEALSFAFDYDNITCLTSINAADSFIYATSNTVRIVTCDYENTLFGEPTFKESSKIESGIVNQESFIEILGDYAFIDPEGIKSFNAVKQLNDEGRNSYFSLNLTKRLNGIKQYRTIACAYDNYAIFNLDTSFGNVMCIYDMLREKWVSIDITECIHIKNFAYVQTTTATILYAITRLNKVFQLFKGPSTEVAMLETKAYAPADVMTEHKTVSFRPFFSASSNNDGSVTVLEYVDEEESLEVRETKILEQSIGGINYPVMPPVKPNNKARSDCPQFTFTTGLIGKKIAYTIMWNTDASLKGFEVITQEFTGNNTQKEKQSVYNNTYVATS